MSRHYTDTYRGWESVETPRPYPDYLRNGDLVEDQLPSDYIESLCNEYERLESLPEPPTECFPQP